MTYMLLLNCALKLVEEIILYYDARLKKHQKKQSVTGEHTRGKSNSKVGLLHAVKAKGESRN